MGTLSRCLAPQLGSVFDYLKMLFFALLWTKGTLYLMEALLFLGAAPLRADEGAEGGLGVAPQPWCEEGVQPSPSAAQAMPLCPC